MPVATDRYLGTTNSPPARISKLCAVDHRPFKSLDRTEDGDRGEGLAGRVDDDGIRALSSRLDQVDKLALMVRLVKDEIEAEARRVAGVALLDPCQRGRAEN